MQTLKLKVDSPAVDLFISALGTAATNGVISDQKFVDIASKPEVQITFTVEGIELPFVELIEEYTKQLNRVIKEDAEDLLQSKLFKLQTLLSTFTEAATEEFKSV